ncbi:MAG TPA: hypothetical protein V6D28_27250 [Leptolyngbyaceae cyanobacterium]
MIDFHFLSEFSRTHCAAICAFLVPANLLFTLYTIAVTVLGRPRVQINQAAALAYIPAVLMILHVFSWLVIGVVMAPTYILFALGTVCLTINSWAIAYPASITRLFKSALSKATVALDLVK